MALTFFQEQFQKIDIELRRFWQRDLVWGGRSCGWLADL